MTTFNPLFLLWPVVFVIPLGVIIAVGGDLWFISEVFLHIYPVELFISVMREIVMRIIIEINPFGIND